MSRDFLEGKRLVRFEALQAALVPRSRDLNWSQREHGRELVNQLLAIMSAADRRALAQYLLAIDVFSLLYGLRPFQSLSETKQAALLGWLFDCPIPLLRKGFWGLNSLAKLSVYGQPSLGDNFGYHVRKNPDA